MQVVMNRIKFAYLNKSLKLIQCRLFENVENPLLCKFDSLMPIVVFLLPEVIPIIRLRK